MRSIYIIFISGVLFIGCIKTEGPLNLEGKIIDESTKVQVPGRKVIIQGIKEINNKFVPVDAGQFSTDSAGCFKYNLERIKNVRYYNFCIVGDSDYASKINKLGLLELKENARYLFFSVNKLVDLIITIQKISKTDYCDTIYLTWESNKVDYTTLYPFEIVNHGLTGNTFDILDYFGLRWIGENVNSTIKTRVLEDKLTLIHWELVRNKKRNKTTDTIVCKRDLKHIVYFKF